ncbi:MAG: MFS transporter [Acidimicrobiia bacterium]
MQSVERVAADGRVVRRGDPLVVALVGTVVGSVLNTGVGVGVPDVLRSFPGTPVATSTWILTAYILGTAAFMPAAGRLVDVVGVRKVFAGSTVALAGASLLCAAAPSFEVLAVGRLLQGLFGASVLPVVFQVVQQSFDPRARGRALSVWAATNGASLAVGPLVGGVLTDLGGWRLIHLAVLPVLGAAVVAARRLPDREPGSDRGPVAGAVPFTAAAVLATVAVAQLPVWGPTSPVFLGTAAAAAALGWACTRRLRQAPRPFIDLAVLSRPQWRVACAVVALQMVAMYGVLLALPLLVVEVRGRSTSFASAAYAVMPVASVLLARAAGRLVDRAGFRPPMRVGGLLLGLGGLALLGAVQGSLWWLAPGLVLVGAGIGLVQTPSAAAAAEAAHGAGSGPALGLFNSVRFLAGSAGATGFTLLLRAVAGTSDVDSLHLRPPAAVHRGFGAIFAGVALSGLALLLVASRRPVPGAPAPAG